MVLICILLLISDVEHLFMYLLATYKSSMQKCPFRSFAHFLIRLFVVAVIAVFVFYIGLYEFLIYFGYY